jgi:hypothetical protein
MASTNTPALELIRDAVQRLGKARLSLDLAKELMEKGGSELLSASDLGHFICGTPGSRLVGSFRHHRAGLRQW